MREKFDGLTVAELDALIAKANEVRDETRERRRKELRAEIAELRVQLDQEHTAQGSQQQELSRRMSELSAKHHDILKQVRQKVREIATRARREGKAERPHANA